MLQKFSDSLERELNESLISTALELIVPISIAAAGIYMAFASKPDEYGAPTFTIEAPRLEALIRKYHIRKLNPNRVKKIVVRYGINIAEFKKELRSSTFTKAMNRLINATMKLSKDESNKTKDAVINAKKELGDAINNLEPKQRGAFRELMADLKAEEQW